MKPKTKNIIAELPNCQQVLDSLLVHLPAHVYWKNINGVYIGCNDRQAHSLGLKRGIEVIGKTDFELPWSREFAERFWENDCRVINTAQSTTVEELAIVNGEEAIVLSLKVPLKNQQGDVLGVLGISVDITQQKRTEVKLIQAKEAAEAASHAKMEFLANMRHDLRTPMFGIKGCAQAIRDNIADPSKLNEMKEFAHDLDLSSNALLTLLNTVLESIQVANGNFLVHKKRFNLYQQLKQIIQLNQALAKYKNVKLDFIHDERIPLLVGDGDRIQRIVLELVTNALNFTAQGSVILTTELAKRKSRTAIIKISVKDTGMGIPLEVQSAIFTRFKRLIPAYQGQYSGAGLGLSIIKQLVDDVEGEIYFESHLNSGTIFTCILPLKVALLQDEKNSLISFVDPSSPTKKNTATITSKHVLIVEDNLIAARVTAALLVKLNCTVEIVHDAKSALDKSKCYQYDLILMDIGLPDRSGDQVAEQIRQDSQNINQLTPIVAVTAHSDEKTSKQYLQSGMNKVLLKPLSQEVILEILKSEK